MALTEIVIVLVLILANAVFSGAEIAIVALRKGRIQELADEGRGSARAVLALRQQPETFLATVQVGITVVSATAAAFGGSSLAEKLEPVLAQNDWTSAHAEGLSLALVVGAVSYLSIVIGELVPKSLALRSAEGYALLVSRPLLMLATVARPLVWLLSSSANLLLRPFADKTTFTEARHSPEELQQLVEEAMQAGTVHPEAAQIASRALELPEVTVDEVMVPRQEVIAISRDSDKEALRLVLAEHTHSRFPVYDREIDNVVGYISLKDVVGAAWGENLLVRDKLRNPFFVPATKKAVDLLKEMRSTRVPFAIVVDEHGGMSGIVTLEDLLEELVGEIFDEHQRPISVVGHADEDSALVLGSAPIRELTRALDVDLPDDGPWTTIAGLVIALAGRVPRTGERFSVPSGLELEVVEASPRRVKAVRICGLRKAAEAEPV